MNTKTTDNLLKITPIGGLHQFGANCTSISDNRGLSAIIDYGIGLKQIYGSAEMFAYTTNIKVKQIILTHAHEDHIGGLRLIKKIPELSKARLICTEELSEIIKSKCSIPDSSFQIVKENKWERIEDGVSIMFIPINHSIIYSYWILISYNRSGVKALIMHTGDWRVDEHPLMFPNYFPSAISMVQAQCNALGAPLILCSESTNVSLGKRHKERTELEVGESIVKELTSIHKSQQIIFVTFSSNVSRLKSVIRAANALDRKIYVLGKTCKSFVNICINNNLINKAEASKINYQDSLPSTPPNKRIIFCAGSQGEPSSNIYKALRGDLPHVTLDENTTVVFSAKIIPSNYDQATRLRDSLAKKLINVSWERDLHCSGHAVYSDIKRMYECLSKSISYIIPIHGCTHMLYDNVKLAKQLNIKSSVIEPGNSLTINKNSVIAIKQKTLKSIENHVSGSGDMVPSTSADFANMTLLKEVGTVISMVKIAENRYILKKIGYLKQPIELEFITRSNTPIKDLKKHYGIQSRSVHISVIDITRIKNTGK